MDFKGYWYTNTIIYIQIRNKIRKRMIFLNQLWFSFEQSHKVENLCLRDGIFDF